MRWFNKGKRGEIWDNITLPIPDDLEAARKIREICNAAVSSAEITAGQFGREETKAASREAQRYKRAARVAMEIAIKMTDNLVRDAAVCQIVVLCMKAKDLKTAGILFRAVQEPSIREDLLNEHPVLRQGD
ncbi:hypothetical protein SAMN05444158_2083 [Bradyrhizobium canariense]|uniref:Uncharacterized protein n=1 Tax=Bradyrhizobium canariense TaxID=255045 RepID=A0A1H1S9J7_9BRAD|nr:hypothetical protein SAMN05444158_2083 [Bradyrhizobium canariense]